jgi:hypothetical protein
MGYSSFRHFITEQFPNIRFAKTEVGIPKTMNVEMYETKAPEAREQQQPPPQPTLPVPQEQIQATQVQQIQLQPTAVAASVMQPTLFVDGTANTTFTTPAGNTYLITQVLPTGFCQVPANFQTVSIATDAQGQPTTYTLNPN